MPSAAPGWRTISCCVLRFSANAFWSLSLYDTTHNFTPNPANRYSIGDRTAGLFVDQAWAPPPVRLA